MATQELLDLLTDLTPNFQDSNGRANRKRCKGLPDEAARIDLARTYLKAQLKLWPNLAKGKVLHGRTESNAVEMAETFRQSFETGSWALYETNVENPPWKHLGAVYLRYSHQGSNPRSLDQQLQNTLSKARELSVFIPWQYVFADAAVTGTTAARRGYQMAKALLQKGPPEVSCLVVDEIGRASRDALEALHLGRLIELAAKRMVGASDGFDSASVTGKMQLHFYAMIHEMFVDQLREKVRRGMRDAFERGKIIHAPAIGYKDVPVTGDEGHPILNDDGRVMMERVIDELEAEFVRKAFELYADRGWSRDRMAQWFNEQSVGGRRSWESCSIKLLLGRSLYRGIEFNEMTFQVRDPVTGTVTVKRRPESEWKRREVPHLRIVDDALWDRVATKMAKTKEVYDPRLKSGKPSRTELYYKSLIRPLCGDCGQPLWLGRSGKYASYFCLNGKLGKHGCKLRGYKSARIIEDAVLGRVTDEVLTDSFISEVVEAANRFLAEQPNNAVPDTSKMEALIQKKTRAIGAVTRQLGDADETTDLKPVFDELAQMQREVTSLKERLAAAQAMSGPKPPPLVEANVRDLFNSLRDLLRDDIGAAAPALAALTGPVTVKKAALKDGGAREWTARFTLNAVPVMLSLARKKDCPTTATWEFLNTRGWTMSRTCEVWVRHVPKHERIAERASIMRANGASVESIAHCLGETMETVKHGLTYAATGQRPKTKPKGRKTGTRSGTPRYKSIADDVVRMRDENLSFVHIAKTLKVSTNTVTRAFDYSRPTVVQEAVANGARPNRGAYRHLSLPKFQKIGQLLRLGNSASEIANQVDCGVNTVYREKNRLGL